MKTPGPTPALLPPARIDAIRAIATAAPAGLYAEPDPGATCAECEEHMAGEGAAILRTPGGGGALIVLNSDNDAATLAFHREARGMVLEMAGHLDALQAPAPAPSVRKLYRDLMWTTDIDDVSARQESVALQMYARGHAAALASLQAPAPDDGGEALGRGLYERGRSISMSGAQVIPWECLTDNMKSEHIENAIALDAAGYARGLAAGRSEGEAERVLCQAATEHVRDREELITRLREQVTERDATIARLTAERDAARSEAHASAGALLAPKIELATMGLRAELAEARAALSDAERLMGAAIDNGATDRARALTAEADLDAERSLTTELRAMEAEALASADRWRAASERHEQEAAEARAALDAAQREYIEATERADIAEATVGNLRAELAEARATLDARMGHLDAALATIGTASAAARLDGAQKEREAMLPVHKALVELEHWAKRFETEPQGVGLDAVEKRLAQARREATRVNLAENERRARGEGRQG